MDWKLTSSSFSIESEEAESTYQLARKSLEAVGFTHRGNMVVAVSGKELPNTLTALFYSADLKNCFFGSIDDGNWVLHEVFSLESSGRYLISYHVPETARLGPEIEGMAQNKATAAEVTELLNQHRTFCEKVPPQIIDDREQAKGLVQLPEPEELVAEVNRHVIARLGTRGGNDHFGDTSAGLGVCHCRARPVSSHRLWSDQSIKLL